MLVLRHDHHVGEDVGVVDRLQIGHELVEDALAPYGVVHLLGPVEGHGDDVALGVQDVRPVGGVASDEEPYPPPGQDEVPQGALAIPPGGRFAALEEQDPRPALVRGLHLLHRRLVRDAVRLRHHRKAISDLAMLAPQIAMIGDYHGGRERSLDAKQLLQEPGAVVGGLPYSRHYTHAPSSPPRYFNCDRQGYRCFPCPPIPGLNKH